MKDILKSALEKIDKQRDRRARRRKFLNKLKIHSGKYEFYFWLAPVAAIIIPIDRLEEKRYRDLTWSKEKAEKYLLKELPYEVDFEEDKFWFYIGWSLGGRKNQKWARKFKWELIKYLKEEFQIEGYTKTVDGEWITFEKEKENV